MLDYTEVMYIILLIAMDSKLHDIENFKFARSGTSSDIEYLALLWHVINIYPKIAQK